MRAVVSGAARLFAVCGMLLSATPELALAEGLGGFAGTWVRDARESDDAARDAVIVRATEPMSFPFRTFARRVMRKRMVPTEQFVIEEGGGGPQIRNDRGIVFPLDGRVHAISQDREVTSRLTENGEIEQSWREADSYGTTTWRPAGDDQVIVSQHIFDSHFEAPLEYATTYRRVE